MRSPRNAASLASLLAVSLTLASGGVARAAEAPPVVLGARADPAMNKVTIRGRHLGSAPPSVWLDGQQLQTVSGNDGAVQATLPPGTKAGRHTLQLRRADGATTTAQVTVGAPAGPSRSPAATPTGPPVIEGATAEPDMAVVTIRAANLGTEMPLVTLGGKALRPLTYDGSTVVARLPPKTAPGKYTIAVKRSDGAAASLQATLGR